MIDCRVWCCHVVQAEPALMARVRQAFIDEGFSSVAEELSAVLNRRFERYGLPVSLAAYDPGVSDTLAHPEGRALCRVAFESARPTGRAGTLVVGVVCDGQEGADQVTGVLARSIEDATPRPGLPDETREVERLRSTLQTLSPNGKLLADGHMASVVRELYDAQARQFLRRIVETFGTEPATREALLQALAAGRSGRRPKKALDELLGVSAVFRPSYLIGCADCGERALTFATKQQADRALRQAVDKRCSFCHRGTLAVHGAYSASEAAAKALQQGLWLESLVYDTLQPHSLIALAGRMLEAFELDVACVAYGRVVLVECKDAPFGQGDYVNLVVKAQELAADVVAVVTTNPLHENVKRLVAGQRERPRRAWLVAEGTEDAAEIAGTIGGWVEGWRQDYLRRVFSGEAHLALDEFGLAWRTAVQFRSP